jgi:hypothetical protein
MEQYLGVILFYVVVASVVLVLLRKKIRSRDNGRD